MNIIEAANAAAKGERIYNEERGEWIEFSRSSDYTAPDSGGRVTQLRAPRRIDFPNAYQCGILGSRR